MLKAEGLCSSFTCVAKALAHQFPSIHLNNCLTNAARTQLEGSLDAVERVKKQERAQGLEAAAWCG